MGSSQQSYLSSKVTAGSSGSQLLDSFNALPPAVTCLQNQPVVDIGRMLNDVQEEISSPSLAEDCCASWATPRDIAIMRLNRVLKLDRANVAQTASTADIETVI